MTNSRTFGGWTSTDARDDGREVALVFDDDGFVEWRGVPPVATTTPWADVRNLQLRVGKEFVLAVTLDGVSRSWRSPRDVARDDITDAVRAHGGDVIADRRRRRWLVAAVAVVLLVATMASYLTWRDNSTTSSATVAQVAAINIHRLDLPPGWHDSPSALLTSVVGNEGSLVTSSTLPPKLTGIQATIWSTVVKGYQRCFGESNRRDRLFGSAGQLPALQVSGNSYSSTQFGGSELASLTQFYADPSMVQRDVAQYRRPHFGSCFAEANARILSSSVSGRVNEARQSYPVMGYTPVTFAHGFRRGGIATVQVLGVPGTLTLVSLFFAVGQYEVNIYALTPKWTQMRPTMMAAVDAVLGRLSQAGSAGAA